MVHEGRVKRITFSRSLAEHVIERAGKGRVERFDVVLGRALDMGETSSSGLYALIRTKNGRVLRVATSFEEADLLCDYVSRCLYEARLVMI